MARTLDNHRIQGGGILETKETTAPSNTAGYGKWYVKSSDNKPYFKTSTGTEYDLTSGSGGSATGFVLYVRCATTTALASNTYNNGAGTLTSTTNNAFPAQDGVTLTANQSILVKNQSNAYENGIYTLTQVGDGSNPWILTRRSDFNSITNIVPNIMVSVSEGTLNADYSFRLNINTDPITLGTTNLDFVPVLAPSTLVFYDIANSRIGINNPTPQYTFDINGSFKASGISYTGDLFVTKISGNPSVTVRSYSNGVFDGANIALGRTRGTSTSSFSAIQSGDIIGAIQFQGAYDTNTFSNIICQIQVSATENYGPSNLGNQMKFETVANGSTSRLTRAILANGGSFTLGSTEGVGTGILYCANAVHSGDVLPSVSSTYYLGSSTYRWSNIYSGSGNFSNTVIFAQGTTSIAPISLQAGTNLTSPVNGSVEYDGSRMYLTVGGVRKTMAFTSDTAGFTLNSQASLPYTIPDGDTLVEYTGTSGGTFTLPSATNYNTKTLTIKDAGGNAGTNNITIQRAGGALIDGATSISLISNYASVTLYSNGTNWRRI